jgi:periplasmic divalent cation tolerance protein
MENREMLYLVLSTFPDADSARVALQRMVREKWVVCAQMDSPIQSFYSWQGEFCEDSEIRVSMKCLSSQLEILQAEFVKLHPYDCPQWICIQADHVSEEYMAWARSSIEEDK